MSNPESPQPQGSPHPAPAPSTGSPLDVPRVDSIDDLLSRDPMQMSDADLDSLISHFRAQRVTFIEAEKAAKAAGKKRTVVPKTDAAKEANKLSLEDLL